MTAKAARARRNSQSRLQKETARHVVAMLAEAATAPGEHLSEVEFSRALRVSRTPIRGALTLLAKQGLVEFHPGRGFFLKRTVRPDDAVPAEPANRAEDALYVAIARARINASLADECSESDLMRRFKVTRPLLTRVLRQLAALGMAERKRGHGWRFISAPSATSAAADCCRFRMIVEPACLLEPGFTLPGAWARSIRSRHEAFLRVPPRDFSAVNFFEMNAEFHEELARASGNTQLHKAVEQQTKLRRFLNYDWVYGIERVKISVREHLAILDAIESGNRIWAAQLLRQHIESAENSPDTVDETTIDSTAAPS